MGVNLTTSTDFLLLGLSDHPGVKVLLFCTLLLLYILTLIGNLSIVLVSRLDKHLHTPMYFFLGNLAFLDICYTSTTMPKMLQILLAEDKSITFIACVTQMYLFVACVGTGHVLLAVMSYDRYLAICQPFRYLVLMNFKVCANLAFVSWFCGLLNSVVHTIFTFRLNFCRSRRIEYFFCDIPALLSLSCSDTSVNQALLVSVGVLIGWGPFLSIVISYIYILVTIMKISSTDGRQKSFSTCASHLAVVILYYGSAIANYMRPVSSYSLGKDRLVSILYSMVTPMLNPIIYTFRNQDVKNAISKLFKHRRKL
ncbi:olfactory receptor 5V1-like [Hyperolius riggenbachi]|uniref:olfactory receptor 5V1-like n=1 Tax=Hyperolius riggenbachi TaxID=752182 RepID=UPI0035A2EADB